MHPHVIYTDIFPQTNNKEEADCLCPNPKGKLQAPEQSNIDLKTNSQMSKILLIIASLAGCCTGADGPSKTGLMFCNSKPQR